MNLSSANKFPTVAVWTGLLFAIGLDTGVQILWKLAVAKVHSETVIGIVEETLTQPLFWLVVVMFLLQLFNWRKVLEKADLSFAQPITSLSYVSVLGLSTVCLHEHISIVEVGAVVLILIGVFFISRSEASTVCTKGPVEP